MGSISLHSRVHPHGSTTARRKTVRRATAVLLAAGLAVAGSAAPGSAAPKPKPPKTIGFTQTTAQITEGQGSVCLYAQRSVTTGKAPTATMQSTDGTATAGVDYTAVSGTYSFPKKSSTLEVCVPILSDGVPEEADETFVVTLSTTSTDWIADPSTATVTIHEQAAPGAPTDLVAQLHSGSTAAYVSLAWLAPASGYVAHYAVYKSPAETGPWTELGTTTARSFDVTPAPTTDTYYAVKAVNGDGSASEFSNVALAEGFVPGTGLFWADGSHGIIRAANPDGTGVYPVVSGDYGPFGVAVDATHLYWADTANDAVMRSDLDGANVMTLVSDAANSHPYGVAVDATHVYWTDLQTQLVKRADLDGSNVVTLVDGTGLLQPAAIAVDGTYLYLGDVAGNGKIMRANLDGTGLETLVETPAYPFAVAVDSGHLYWAITGSNEGADGAIWRSALDGSGAATIATNQAHPAGIAVDSTHVYWANANNGTINRSGLDGSGLTTIVTGTVASGGVAVVR
jgi:sugar lactone lactonase YvrE